MSSSARRELGQVPLRALLTEERGHILDVIKAEVAAKAEPLGVKVDEVRFDRSDLPFETSQAIYDRMKSERQREGEGAEGARLRMGAADRGQRRPRSHRHPVGGSPRRGDRARRGDAEADRALAEAFSQDPQFYTFYRSLRDLPQRARQFGADDGREPGRRLHSEPQVRPQARGRVGAGRGGREALSLLRAAALARPARALRRAGGQSERAEGGSDLIDGAAWIVVLVQILCVDLLLGADNAVVIALACSRLPTEETRRAVMLGAVGAIALRLGMLAFANALLDVPLVKLIAAWTLIVIALNVRARKADDEGLATTGEPAPPIS